MQPISMNAHIKFSSAAQISKAGKIISKGVKTRRLVFDLPNKRTDIDIAIAENPKALSALMKHHRWAKLKVNVDQQPQEVYVNINSLAKRLGIDKSDIFKAIKEHRLEGLVSDQILNRISSIASEKPTVIPQLRNFEKSPTSLIEKLKGALVDAWWTITTGGWDLFRLRFLIGASDEQLQKEGQSRAITAYHNAYKRVPAYREHIDKNRPKKLTHFEDIPLTGKKEYIQKVENLDDLYLDGKLPKRGQLDSSTGTTGEPAVWMRSAEEMTVSKKLMSFAKKAKFGSEDIAVINTFALGLWATGITLAGTGPEQGLTANIGVVPDYAEKTVMILKKLSAKNPKKPFVLCGYPPNIRKIADAIQADPVLKARNLTLHAVVGGEGMTEELRQDILNLGFKTVFSSYGASDLDINIGFETETEVAIRKACIANPALAAELYGGGPPPMIFNYDPLHYFIETTKEEELVFTCCRKERASPRIRYNLHDRGKIMMAKDLKAVLKKYGVEITPRTNLPFLFIHGREGSVSFGGAKVHYEHLEQAVREIDTKGLINRDRFALHKPQENKLEFWIEAASDEAYESMKANLATLKREIIAHIASVNTEFKDVLKGATNPEPQIRLFKSKRSPMSMTVEAFPHRKLQRVVPDNEEVREQLRVVADAMLSS